MKKEMNSIIKIKKGDTVIKENQKKLLAIADNIENLNNYNINNTKASNQ